ncbi:TonB family protein [Acinetobacter sp. MD2(2019)]|uniref:TonB family protein n=1 Tax=Acinetobacter sp. MD2(2019) TaxID=2605273 RepID=UPI002D1E7145|nr:TonB family protein [Acinetobacter sp. MD2(2019)]MEB3753369.1 TonB family protein [Acinetobacter sp. MD2(2019)]
MNTVIKTIVRCCIPLLFSLSFQSYAAEPSIANLTQNQVKWLRKPYVNINNKILLGYDRTAQILFETSPNGQITDAKIIKSSGLDKVDNILLKAIKSAKLSPYQENGVYYPVRAMQPFSILADRTPKILYEPNITVSKRMLQGQERSMTLYATADNNGNINQATIIKSSGVAELDEYVLQEYRQKVKFHPLIINGKPYPIQVTQDFTFSKTQNSVD